MKKAIIAAIASLAFAGTAFASAPAMNVDAGQIQAGYTNYNLKTNGTTVGDMGTFRADSYQLVYGLSSNLAFTGEYLNSETRNVSTYFYNYPNLSFNSTQLGLQYQMNKNIALSVGNVKSGFKSDAGSNSNSEVFAGIAYNAPISSNLNGYASYLKSSHVEDAKVGVKYAIGNNASFDVGYRNYQDSSSGITAKGMGFGLNYKL